MPIASQLRHCIVRIQALEDLLLSRRHLPVVQGAHADAHDDSFARAAIFRRHPKESW